MKNHNLSDSEIEGVIELFSIASHKKTDDLEKGNIYVAMLTPGMVIDTKKCSFIKIPINDEAKKQLEHVQWQIVKDENEILFFIYIVRGNDRFSHATWKVKKQ
jgi:hypothetical protein